MLQRTLKRCPTALLALLMSWFVVAVPVSAVAANPFPVEPVADACAMPMMMDITTCGDVEPHVDCADCEVTSCQCPQLLMTHSALFSTAQTFTTPFPDLVASSPDHPNAGFKRPPKS